MKGNIGIVFIHGAGLNSSIWDGLKQEINLDFLMIDFPNRKINDNANKTLTFNDYVNSTIEQIKNWKTENFIIVAHSIGACVGLEVATHFKHELRGFIAISSVIPKNGNSFASSLPFPQKIIMPIILKLFGTKPPKKSIENELCNDLTDQQTTKITTEFTSEAKALYTTEIKFNLPENKRLYIQLTNDKSMPLSLQNKMAKNLNADKIEVLYSGHLPMLSKPKELATIVLNFVNEIKQDKKNKNPLIKTTKMWLK